MRYLVLKIGQISKYLTSCKISQRWTKCQGERFPTYCSISKL